MTSLDNVSPEDLRQVLAEVEGKNGHNGLWPQSTILKKTVRR